LALARIAGFATICVDARYAEADPTSRVRRVVIKRDLENQSRGLLKHQDLIVCEAGGNVFCRLGGKRGD